MKELAQFARLPIDWDLSPEDAVTMYLEWGNNDWNAAHPPVRSKQDYSNYFVVDSWGPQPVLRLVRRNSETAVDLLAVNLPEDLRLEWEKEYPGLRGVFEPLACIKEWLKRAMELS